MELIWTGIGFLVGMSLWIPFIVGARIDATLARLEGRVTAQVVRIGGEGCRER